MVARPTAGTPLLDQLRDCMQPCSHPRAIGRIPHRRPSSPTPDGGLPPKQSDCQCLGQYRRRKMHVSSKGVAVEYPTARAASVIQQHRILGPMANARAFATSCRRPPPGGWAGPPPRGGAFLCDLVTDVRATIGRRISAIMVFPASPRGPAPLRC